MTSHRSGGGRGKFCRKMRLWETEEEREQLGRGAGTDMRASPPLRHLEVLRQKHTRRTWSVSDRSTGQRLSLVNYDLGRTV